MALITKNPTSNVSPDPGQGGDAVTGNINTGHASTTAAATHPAGQTKTCKWTAFASGGGLPLSIVLKFDWTQNGVFLGGFNRFRVQYSLNGGSSWNDVFDHTNINSSSSGSSQAVITPPQDIAQVQVRDILDVLPPFEQSESVTGSISNIRLEITTFEPPPVTIF
jgi:hypothetical protein